MGEISRLESSDSNLLLQLEQLRESLQGMPAGASGADVDALKRRLETDLGRVEALERSRLVVDSWLYICLKFDPVIYEGNKGESQDEICTYSPNLCPTGRRARGYLGSLGRSGAAIQARR